MHHYLNVWLLGQLAQADPLQYPGAAWSPYIVGALIGVLSMLTFYFSDKPLGASTAYARIAGMVGKAVAPQHTESLKYYQENKPIVDWEVMLVIGVNRLRPVMGLSKPVAMGISKTL
ncbi:MAG: hypothetical protein IT423_21735 [Pirellulaceae bacterium]|nr:hypothetical protein [Pirellulaceae bacterium]